MSFSNLVNLRLNLLNMAANHIDHANDVDRMLQIARKFEAYVFEPIDADGSIGDAEAARRKAFLDQLDKTTHCGAGKEGCDGSEGTCTC